MQCGRYEVWEDREAGSGRTVALNIAVLPARSANPLPDPVFFLVGGPGGAATRRAKLLWDSWMRQDREVVLVDLRGTGESNALMCDLAGGPDDIQGYLANGFEDLEGLRRCRDGLAKSAEPDLYTLPIAMDDLDEVRVALGYERINVVAGSWGTRAALLYLRRHGESVRTMVLNGIAPVNALYGLTIAEDAQRSLDLVLEECAGDPVCNGAFPRVADEIEIVLGRLADTPATVEVRDPHSGESVPVVFSRQAFAEELRYFLSSLIGTRYVPWVIHEAHAGRFEALAQDLVDTNWFFADRLAIGELLTVTCAEDVSRIDPADVPAHTRNTFMGETRLRQILAACEVWNAEPVPESYGEPVVSTVPVLLWSGTLDPRNPPRWGEEASRHLEQSLHLVVPGAHIVSGDCVDRVSEAFLGQGSVKGLDTRCTHEIELPPFVLSP
jgi:pimeloyl-ACP methyl ester carboxylesterase